MIRVFKDPYKLSLLLSAIFFAGILATFYVLYSTSHTQLTGEGEDNWSLTYLVTALAFLAGCAALFTALKYKKEIVVFREKTLDASQAEKDAALDAANTISLETVKASLQQDNQSSVLQEGLHAVCKQLEAGQGALYLSGMTDGTRIVELKNGYALNVGESTTIKYEFGEGLVGQSAAEGRTLYLDDVPEGYIKIISGLGSASPRYLLITPLKKDGKVLGVLEIASFRPYKIGRAHV